jgi:hypothetical protein
MIREQNLKMEKPTCILITGIPHAGTRLLVQMLNEHPDERSDAHFESGYGALWRSFTTFTVS